MIWSVGYTTLAIGHLNILSSAFGSILVGLGINYSIYTVARYLQLRGSHQSVSDALTGTHGSVAPGITIGATTTALSLLMAGFTEFTGVAELGLVACGGIILCWIAAMVLLPAILRLSDSGRPERLLPVPLHFHRWIDPLVAHPGLVLVLSLAATVAIATAVPDIQFDYNLLNMEPEVWRASSGNRNCSPETTDSVNFALSVADSPEDALAQKRTVSASCRPWSGWTRSLRSTRPTLSEKRAIVCRVAERLVAFAQGPAKVAGPLSRRTRPVVGAGPANARRRSTGRLFAGAVPALGEMLRRIPAAECETRLASFQKSLVLDVWNRLQVLRSVANPQPPLLADLPEGLVKRFVGKTGKLLLRVYSKGNSGTTTR